MKILYKSRDWNQGIGNLMVLFTAMLMVCVVNTSVAATQKCSQDEAMKGMSEASDVKTWVGLYKSYKKYKQCDGGAISEGYSGAVADLLANHWTHVGDLVKLSNSDPYFGRFVINHIDETMSLDEGKRVKENATVHCPASAERMCTAIKKRFLELGFNG